MVDVGRVAGGGERRRAAASVSRRPSSNDSQIVPSSLELSSWKRRGCEPGERDWRQQSFIFVLNHLHNITAADRIQEILNPLGERQRGCAACPCKSNQR